MTTKTKSSASQANWKIRPETLKRVNQECLNREVTQAVLADIALSALSGVPDTVEPPEVPLGYLAPAHRRLVHEFIEFLDDDEGRKLLPVVKAVIAYTQDRKRHAKRETHEKDDKEGAA